MSGTVIRKLGSRLLAPLAFSLIPGAFLVAPLVPIAVLMAESPAQAQSAEAIARVAQAITVRLEGATQGSGVLVRRDGDRYTVLTAWHVVEGQKPGEELDIYTSDGQRHQVEQGSIQRLGEADIAVLVFSSSSAYSLAQTSNMKSVSTGSTVFVSGFPLSTDSVKDRAFRFLRGDIVSGTEKTVGNSRRLLYNNLTLPGMSGGSVLNMDGYLVGIHAKAERADAISEASGKAIATGINIGIPINHYLAYLSSRATATSGDPSVDKSVVASRPIEWPSDSSNTPAKSENKPQSIKSAATNVIQQPGSSSLYAWRLDPNGILELRTRPRALLIASMEDVNDALVGSRVWIDLPGSPSVTTSIPGSGAVLRVRIGRPDDKTTRLVVEFKPGTSPDPRRLRLIGTSPDRWRMDFGLRAAPSAPIGQGQI